MSLKLAVDLGVRRHSSGPTIPPTWREGDQDTLTVSTNFNYTNTGLAGDRTFGIHCHTTTSGTPTVSISDTTEIFEEIGTGHGTVFNSPYTLRALESVIGTPPDSRTFTLGGGGGNNLTATLRGIFVGSSVNGEAILQYCHAIDTMPLFDFTATADAITFPTVAVPEGYTALYLAQFGSTISGFGWATATERSDSQSFAATGKGQTMATLEGPHDGSGVVLTKTGILSTLQGRGMEVAMFLVPGT